METAQKGEEESGLAKGWPGSTADHVEDCPVCLTTFDDTRRRPRTVPCGHTLCTPCINGLTKQDQVTCPTCRSEHSVPKAGQFPVSYTIEALIRRLRGDSPPSPSPISRTDIAKAHDLPVTGTGHEGIAKISNKVNSLLQEQETKVLAAIRSCQEVQAQLDHYQTVLTGWSERQQQYEIQLEALVNCSKSARDLVRQEEDQVVTKKEDMRHREQKLHIMLQTLRKTPTEEKVRETSSDVANLTEESQRAKECIRGFPDIYTVNTINKVRQASHAALKAAATFQTVRETVNSGGGTSQSSLKSPSASSIADRLEALLTQPLKDDEPLPHPLQEKESLHHPQQTMDLPSNPLQAKDLHRLTQPIRNALQADLVFAVHHKTGRRRHARISLLNDRLYLHFLRGQTPPSNSFTLQMDKLVPAVPPCLVFLDLAGQGSIPRRVLIHLSRDTPRGIQFLLLCTGQRGPCFANTRLLSVVNRGLPGEYVFGGDYEYNSGKGGAALLSHLDDGEYQKTGRAGGVGWMWSNDADRGAQFWIATRDWNIGDRPRVFGRVVEGLEVLTAAVWQGRIRELTVVDCGVVLGK